MPASYYLFHPTQTAFFASKIGKFKASLGWKECSKGTCLHKSDSLKCICMLDIEMNITQEMLIQYFREWIADRNKFSKMPNGWWNRSTWEVIEDALIPYPTLRCVNELRAKYYFLFHQLGPYDLQLATLLRIREQLSPQDWNDANLDSFRAEIKERKQAVELELGKVNELCLAWYFGHDPISYKLAKRN